MAQTVSSMVERGAARSWPGMRLVQALALLLLFDEEKEEEPMVPVSGVREEVEPDVWAVVVGWVVSGSSKVLRSAGREGRGGVSILY